jgi:type I restriction enzyme S subunit
MTEWQKVKLGDICKFISTKIDMSNVSEYNYVSTENMLSNKAGIVNATSLPNTAQISSFKTSDTLVSNIRPYFKKIWYASFCGGCSNDVLVFRANNGVDTKFLYYILSNDEFFSYATSTSKGTKMPRGDKVAIMQYHVFLPPLTIQKKIAAVLGALDDKIELNNKINHNLEQQAQALFKSWFIDFEPFGGKMPDDWTTGTFKDLIECTISGDWGKDCLTDKNTQKVYCIRGTDIPDIRQGNKGKMPYRYILPKNYLNKRLSPGDLVVEISGGSPTQSTGRIAAITEHLLKRYDTGMVCTNFCKALKPKQNSSMFIYYYWKFLYQKNVLYQYENGTTGIKNLDINGFIQTEPIILPNEKSIKRFENVCQKFAQSVFSNGYENEQLAQLRDTLLPKLMSGEIDVSNVDISELISTDKLSFNENKE